MLRTHLMQVKGLLLEPFRSAAKAGVSDESVYDFATRRLGKDVADRMIDPLCVGIYGGDCRTLSLKYVCHCSLGYSGAGGVGGGLSLEDSFRSVSSIYMYGE
jgi:protoporphyrinogen oxidase